MPGRCSPAGRKRVEVPHLNNARGQHTFKNTSSSNRFRWISHSLCRLALAAWAPFLPSAVWVFLGSLVIVRSLLAAAAAFLILRRADSVCLVVAIKDPPQIAVCVYREPSGTLADIRARFGPPTARRLSSPASVRTILNSALRARRRARHCTRPAASLRSSHLKGE